MIRVSIAPPLAGPLLVPGARIALANHLFAVRQKGHRVLRLDNLGGDGQAEQVIQDLKWIGVAWDEVIKQAERRDLYSATFERLRADGFLYPCFETEDELKAKEEFRRRRGQPAVYDRAMLRLTDKQRQAAEASGKRPYWRFKLSGRTLEWRDMILGDQTVDLRTVSDPVLMQADGTPTPPFAGLIDDINCKITHLIRGEEGKAATAMQIELLEVLTGSGMAVRFAHLPPLTEPSGTDRRRPVSLRALRQDGVEPSAIVGCLLGQEQYDISHFRLTDFAPKNFTMVSLVAANRRVLARLGYAAVADRLPPGATEAFWLAIRNGVDLLKEARGWWDVCTGTIVPPVIEGEHDLLLKAASLLPAEPWERDVGRRWIGSLEQAIGRNQEDIVPLLRLALTGEDAGPDLVDLLPLIGRARAASRLEIAAA